MAFFTDKESFLTPCFDIDLKEEEKLIKFLKFLEDYSVGHIIFNYVNNNTKLASRPNVNYYNFCDNYIWFCSIKNYCLL